MSQTERIFCIDRLIRERGYATVREVAENFEVCARQVKRDIEYLRDRLEAPIVWAVASRRYEYSESWHRLCAADEKSFFAFAFLKTILTALRCGANCEVMEPQEFRGKWVEEIGRMGELAGNRLFPDVNVIYAHNHDLVVQ